jgi:hypothetical protein
LKKRKRKEKPLVKAGTSSHGLVITGCCPLLDFETKPSVSKRVAQSKSWSQFYQKAGSMAEKSCEPLYLEYPNT